MKRYLLLLLMLSGMFLGSCSLDTSVDGVLELLGAGKIAEGLSTGSTTTTTTTVTTDVYVAGYLQNDSLQRVPGYWKNGVWIALPVIDPAQISTAWDIFVVGTDVHVAGSSRQTVDKAVHWKNGVMTQLPVLDATKTSVASGIFIDGADVYIAGYSQNSSGVNIPVYWKNGILNSLPPQETNKNATASGVFVENGNVHVTGKGAFTGGGELALYWLNGTKTALTTRDSTQVTSGRAVAVDGNNVYIGGYSTNSSGVPLAAYWKNLVRVDLPETANSYVNGIDTRDGVLYSCGQVFESNVYSAKVWSDSSPSVLPVLGSQNYVHGICYDIQQAGNDRYATGVLMIDGTFLRKPVYWKNNEIFELPRLSTDANNQDLPVSIYVHQY